MAKATCTIQPVHALGQFSSRNHHDLPQHLRVYPTREPFMSWFPWITNLLVLSVHCPSPKPLQHTRFPASGHLHSTVSTWQQRASHYSFRIKGGLLAFAQNAFHEYVSTVLEESKRDGWRKAKTCHGKQWSHSPATRWWAATWKNHGKLICRLFVLNHPLGCHLTQTIGASQSAPLPLSDISTLGCVHVCISKMKKVQHHT